MRFRLRSKRNRRRNWTDRIGRSLIGTHADPLSPAQVLHRAIVLVALVLPYFIWNHGQTLVQQGKGWQGRMEARQAEQLRLSGRSDAALCALMHAYDRAPAEPEILRGIAWAAAPSFPLQAKHFLEKLTDAEAMTPPDLMLHASVLLTLDQPAEAAKIYELLVKHQPHNPDVWRAWGAACHQRGELSEAMKAYRHVLASCPHDLQANVGIAELLMRSATGPDSKTGTALLLRQLERSVGARLAISGDVADLIVNVGVTDAAQRAQLASLLRRMPDPAAEHIVAGIFLSYPVAPDAEAGHQRREDVRRFLSTHRDLGSPQRHAVATLLQKGGENGLLLDWTSLADAAGDAVVFSQRLNALMTTGQWREAAEMAAHPAAGDIGTQQPWLHAFRVLSTCREPKAVAERILEQSLTEAKAGGQSYACNAIGFAALDHGLFRLASHAFADSIEHGLHTASPLKEYLHAARRSGEPASGVMRIIATRARGDLSDATLQQQSIYFRLLCGAEIERAALDLEQLRQGDADAPYLKFLNAFMRYRHGDYAGAVKALLPLPARRWHQGETVVISSILAAGGQMQQAAQLASKITGEGVFQEEADLLQSWQSRSLMGPQLLSSVGRW